MKKQYTEPTITVVAAMPTSLMDGMSTGTTDNTGGGELGPGKGGDNEDPLAKEHHFNIWDED